MPTQKTLKGWDAGNKRWQWMIKRNRVGATCEELGLPESQWTQEGSRAAAWKRYCELKGEVAKQAEAAHPHAEQIAVLTHRFQVAKDLGINADDLIAELTEFKALTEADTAPALDTMTAERVKAFELLTGKTITDLDPITLSAFFSNSEVWGERKAITGRTVLANTIGANAKEYISGKIKEAEKGIRSPDGADNLRRWVNKFVAFAGELTAVDGINFKLWELWQVECKAKSERTKTQEALDEYTASRAFVRWMVKQDLLILPKNFDDKMGFTKWRTTIETYTVDEVKKMLAIASGNTKLFILFMLNCGMTQQDISDLRKSEVDLKAGTICRYRSKTKDKSNTPLVTYQLWKPTLALLKECWSEHPELALTTKSGGVWVRKSTKSDGKLSKTDNVKTLWRNLQNANPDAMWLSKLTSLKKTSATLLRNSQFKEYYRFFLGHAESDTAERHYADIDPLEFAKIFPWLAKQYGLKA